MSELYDRARQAAAENRAAEQQQLEYQARQHATEEAERRLSKQRAEEFVEIMQAHKVGQIALCQEGAYHLIPPQQRLQFAWKDWLGKAGHQSYRTLREAQGHRLSVIQYGWVAVRSYVDSVYDYTERLAGVFVNENAESFNCSEIKQSRDVIYVAPFSDKRKGDPMPAPNDRALGSDEAVQRMGQRLVELGIVR